MKRENWSEISEILADCLEIETSRRQKYLNSLSIDPEMRAEVDTYLAFEEDAENLMDISAVEFSKDFFDEDFVNNEDFTNAVAGQQFGAYKVIGELGYGGMGAVYLAERSDGKFEQKVALKLLKREMNTVALRRRFEQERNILASLEHPNIARLLNAGTTADKIPYITMEYVEGLPVDEYCNKNILDLNQRLDLFRQVCLAVDFAHRNLVVHRDLKPSNILVTKDGIPKLLDFGISKILSTEIEQLNSATVTRMGVMTPGYASPEQLQRKSVTTATDIYSLGIILYELLSGHRPFESKEDDLKEIYKAIIETDPPLPSSLVDTVSKQFKKITEAKTEIQTLQDAKSFLEENTKSQNRNSETKANKTLLTKPQPVKLSAQSIRGDLDNIVLKAIRKEPERRYSSAKNLSEDIKRHLRGLPVSARPNTFSYRAEKFYKRNKASVFAGIFILLAIAAGIVATLWQARIAQAERVKAEKRFNDVRTLANKFLFDLAPKIEKLPGSTAAREELVKLSLEYLDSLSNEAGNDSELQRELAMAYEKVGDVQGNPNNANIGDVQNAIKSYQKALSIRQKLFEKEPGNLTLMNELANIYIRITDLQTQTGDRDKRKPLLEKSFILLEKILEREPSNFEARKNMAINLSSQGEVLFGEAKYGDSVTFYERANSIYEQMRAEKSDDPQILEKYANTFVRIGLGQGWNNNTEGGDKSLQKGIEILKPLAEKYPNDYNIQYSLMFAYYVLAQNTLDSGDVSKTKKEYENALEIGQIALKADSQNIQVKRQLAMTMNSLAGITNSSDLYSSSLRLMQEVRKADSNNPQVIYQTALVIYHSAEYALEKKNYESSIELYEKAKDEMQNVIDLEPNYVNAIRVRFFCFRFIGKNYETLAEKGNRTEYLQKALKNYRRALEGLKKMKDNGTLGEFDLKLVPEIQATINKVESKLGK
ncbi:MAG: protein kinase domain-containing protein [Aridibacter sp.]